MRPSEPIGTGRELALRMASAFPEEDWVAQLARRSGKSREFVEWHLQEDMEPPAEILKAAAELLDDAENSSDDRKAEAGGDFVSDDDLPFSGLPGNLGKLQKD